jgi:hypothetical protein
MQTGIGEHLSSHLPPRPLLEVLALLNDAVVASAAAAHAQATGHISRTSTGIFYPGSSDAVRDRGWIMQTVCFDLLAILEG